MKSSNINFNVELDDNNVPTNIQWSAEDNPNGNSPKSCKAILVSIFDKESRDTLKIDLWTTEMQVIEMDRLMYQTLRGLAATYLSSTGNDKLAREFEHFVDYFGMKTEIIPHDHEH